MDKLVICLFVALVAWASEAQAKPKAEPDELIAVAVVFRHGDRTIIETYPNDPYLNYSWPVGLGQLTNNGKERTHNFGLFLRNRYSGFLPDKYSETDIYVRSTNVDRTLMSGASALAGLYPPKDDQIFDDTVAWQPVPIHTTPEEYDEIVAMKKPCAKYTALKQEVLTGQYMTDLLKDNQDILDLCTNETGKEYKTLEDIEYLHDLLKIEGEDFNLTIPDWTSMFYPNRSLILSGISFSIHSFTKNMARLKNGPFWNLLISHFRAVLEKDETAQKFLLFPAHDTTIANLMMSMEAFDMLPPPYSSALLFELHSGGTEPYVTVDYVKTVDEIVSVSVVECEAQCKFDDFVEKLKPVTVATEAWQKECNS